MLLITNRTTSSFPISIGTALALESIFLEGSLPKYDKDREIPNIIKLSNYDEIWINVLTLIRNISGSVNKEIFKDSDPSEILDVLLNEMENINDLFSIEGKNVCIPKYYYCSYNKLKNRYKKNEVRFRENKTEMQLYYASKVNKTLDLLNKNTGGISLFDSEVKSDVYSRSMIMTHFPYDLLSYKNFNKLDLLETHTGKLKTRFQWYTKYYPIGDYNLSNLPFLKVLLLVLGDHVLIQPNDIRLRRVIYDVSEKGKWTSATTLDKVKSDFDKYINEPYVVQFLKSL